LLPDSIGLARVHAHLRVTQDILSWGTSRGDKTGFVGDIAAVYNIALLGSTFASRRLPTHASAHGDFEHSGASTAHGCVCLWELRFLYTDRGSGGRVEGVGSTLFALPGARRGPVT
jgi:hypothetical protein